MCVFIVKLLDTHVENSSARNSKDGTNNRLPEESLLVAVKFMACWNPDVVCSMNLDEMSLLAFHA